MIIGKRKNESVRMKVRVEEINQVDNRPTHLHADIGCDDKQQIKNGDTPWAASYIKGTARSE